MRAGRDGGRRRPVGRWATALAVVVAALAVVGPAAAHPRVHPSGHALGVVPRGHAAHSPSLLALTSPLDYHGGPVLHGMTVRTIFWEPPGHTLPAGYKTLVNRFYTDVAHDSGLTSNPYASVVQYPDGVGPAAYRSTLADTFTTTDPLPTSDCSDPGGSSAPCIEDQDLTAEIAKVMADHGLAPRDGDYYALYLGPNIVDCADDGTGGLICSSVANPGDPGYCAYHSSFTLGSNPANILYANEPYPIPPAGDPDPTGCDTGATPNSNQPADDIIDTSSHEQNETVTDPLGTGWWDDITGEEDGDKCNFDFGHLPPVPADYDTINGNTYLIQREWSNDGMACVASYSDPIAGTFTMRPAGGVEAGQTAEFDASGADSAGVIKTFRWSFGDGSPTSSSALAFTSHVFAAPGTYDVALTAADNTRAGGSDQLITVRPGPVAVITAPSTVPSGTSTVFDASSSSPGDSDIIGAEWSFGDGKTAGGYPSVPHTFARPGTYPVTLTIGDRAGVKVSTTQVETVTNRPPTAVASASTSRPVSGRVVSFDGRGSFDPDGTVQSYAWSFGDGSSGTGPTGRHAFHGVGTRTVTLTVRDDSGASGSTHLTVHVALAPCVVPGLRGLSLRRARSRLTASHCTLGRVGHAHSARVAAGHVLSSSPGRAAHRAHGARVSVTISTGP